MMGQSWNCLGVKEVILKDMSKFDLYQTSETQLSTHPVHVSLEVLCMKKKTYVQIYLSGTYNQLSTHTKIFCAYYVIRW